MNEHFVNLTDGTRMEVKVNFATLYYMSKSGVDRLSRKKKMSDSDKMEIAAKLIYVILRSNGRKVTFDEALCLVPMDVEEIEVLLKDFENKLEKYKKKENAKQEMKKMQSR